ncbi:MAG TPA: nucleoside triphosphate pyrophosphohydrolase [Symbiobacteriaceae bacterium]|nr:nucleoside triphosphate pyrophosphohydrolase [Symbiobacteriaceae bacterium]
MPVYRKLVRDRIPEIIAATGRNCEVEILTPDAYLTELDRKLAEELAEYQSSGDVEELADLLEVVYALVGAKGLTLEQFEVIRQAKVKKRGAFEDRLFLVKVDD